MDVDVVLKEAQSLVRSVALPTRQKNMPGSMMKN
jgi:hypothetical protein|tara:strand:+ start:268 stop:369 length:102 start_codon:yes stop_codon:yes gene_type:complete